MTTTIRFTIFPQNRNFGVDSSLWTSDTSLMARLASLGYDRNPHSGIITVEDLIASPRLAEAFAIIEKAISMRPSDKRLLGFGSSEQFGVTRQFHWSPAEINDAEYLVLTPQLQIAEHATQLTEGNYTVKNDKRTREGKVMFGNLGICGPVPVCRDEIRSGLEAEGFSELEFRPVLGPKGSLERPLWLLWSSKEMPPLSHPLLTAMWEPFAGDISKGCFVESGTEPLYKFSRREVDIMGAFDIAVTPQQIGVSQTAAHRGWIVSQRFRQVLTKLGIAKVDYTPVVYADP